MSFTITLYTNNSRDNERNKNLTSIQEMTGTLKEKSSIIDPVIMVQYVGTLKDCNYMYIPEFGRYYFVNDIVVVRDQLHEIHAHVDVLSSAGANLDTCAGIVRRQENDWNLYLDDGVFKAYSNPLIVQKSFPSGFNTANATYILAVAGS